MFLEKGDLQKDEAEKAFIEWLLLIMLALSACTSSQPPISGDVASIEERVIDVADG